MVESGLDIFITLRLER